MHLSALDRLYCLGFKFVRELWAATCKPMVQWDLSGLQSMNYGFLEAGMHFRFALLTSSLRATAVCRTSPTSPAVGKLQEDRTVCHHCSLCTTFQCELKSSDEDYQSSIYIPRNSLTRFLRFSHAPLKTKLLITPWLHLIVTNSCWRCLLQHHMTGLNYHCHQLSTTYWTLRSAWLWNSVQLPV